MLQQDLSKAISANAGSIAASRLLSINYRKEPDASSSLLYVTAEAAQRKSVAGTAMGYTDIAASLNLQNPERMAEFTKHIFPTGVSWAPEKMDINGRTGRRVMCIVAQDKKRYRIYDVDRNPNLEEREGGKEDGNDDLMFEDES